MTPKVSVIIPVYNVEKYLRECLDSVVNQTLKDIEIICVDDGSTDGSPAILAEYAAKDPRVKVITHPHTNAGAARNAGMAVATGEYLGFVDSDDWCELTLFEKVYAKAKVVNADLVCWRFDQYSDKTRANLAARVFPGQMMSLGDVFSPEQLGTLIFQPIAYAPWCRMVSRSLVEGHAVRFQEIVRTNDVLFCCLVLACARRQSYVNEVLYHYRIQRAGNLQSGNAATPMLVVGVWSEVCRQLRRLGLVDKFGAHVALPSANSLFYTLHTIDALSSFRSFFKALKGLFAPDGELSVIDSASLEKNVQTLFFYETIRKCETAEEYLLFQLNYHRSRLSESWWTGQSLTHDLERTRIDLKRNRDELARSKMLFAAQRTEYEKNLSSRKVECDELRQRLQDANDDLVLLRKKASDLQAALDIAKNAERAIGTELSKVRDEYRRQIAEMSRSIAALCKEVGELKNSESYKVGLVVLWPIRKLFAGIRRIREMKGNGSYE